MFRHAENADMERLLGYLQREPEFNLFIIGDIMNRGLGSDVIDVFVGERGRAIECVLLRYRTSLIPYAHDLTADLSECEQKLSHYLRQGGDWTVSGRSEIVARIQSLLAVHPASERDLFFCVCRRLRAEVHLTQLPLVWIAGPADAREVLNLLGSIAEFEGPRLSEDEFREETEGGTRVTALIRDPLSGEVVSAASSVAESDASAMILGVATRPDHRNKGYASACVYRLVKDLERKGKSACLFFNNPAAGNIYHRLGFMDIGMWRILRFPVS